MRVLHVFDHSIPLHSGYTFRSFQILSEQRKLGIETLHLTSIKHTAPFQDKEEVEGLEFYRTKRGFPLQPGSRGGRLPAGRCGGYARSAVQGG